MKKECRLDLDSEALLSLKTSINAILIKTLSNMENKHSSESEITVKLKINLFDSIAPDYNSKYEATRNVIVPIMQHKVSSIITTKAEVSGFFRDEKCELIWNEEESSYILKPIDDGQQEIE